MNFRKLFQKRTKATIPRFRLFQVDPSTRCNLNCIMCPWKELHTNAQDMTWETYDALSANFKLVEEVDFTGSGEPLMHPDLEQMISGAKRSGCKVGFSSNGVLLTPKRSEKLIEAGLDWVAISFDAATEETYSRIRVGASFGYVLENLRNLQKIKTQRPDRKPYTMLFFVMMKENIHELPAAIELASELSIDFFVAKNLDVQTGAVDFSRSVLGTSLNEPMVREIRNVIMCATKTAQARNIDFKIYQMGPAEQAICEQNPLRTCFVTVDGFVCPCISLAYMKHRFFDGKDVDTPVYRFGNVLQLSIPEIFNSDEFVQFRWNFEKRMSAVQADLFDPLAAGYNGLSNPFRLPVPPRGCGSCYYLYGI